MSYRHLRASSYSAFLFLFTLLQGSLASARSLSPTWDFGPREPERLPFFSKERGRPLETWVVNRRLDREKPLGSIVSPAAVFADGTLVLAYDESWVGGFAFPGKSSRWWYKNHGGLTSPPAVFGDFVILGFRDGTVHKVNLRSGVKEWETRLDTFPTREPIVHEQQLLVVTASQSVYSLDIKSGTSQWLHDGGSPEFLTIRNSAAPTIFRDKVYLSTAQGEILGLDLATGKEIMRHNPDSAPARFRDGVGPLYLLPGDEGRLLMSRSDGLITCVFVDGPKQGSSCWEKPLHSDGITATHFSEGQFFTGSFNGYVAAYDPSSGKKIWQQDSNGTISSLKLVGRDLYSCTSTGKVMVFAGSSGNFRWTRNMEGLVASAPLVIGEGIHYLTGQNIFYGFEVQSR
jgi:outer membrane protein assembly factor BamB